MRTIKNLAEISKDQQKKYLNSFDTVLLDMDGVIWANYQPLPGAPECVSNLRAMGNKVHFVTNNSLCHPEQLLEKLKERKFSADLNDIVNPIETCIAYLKKLNIEGDVYSVSSQPLKDELKKNGFNLVPDPPAPIEESLSGLLAEYDETKVGAVILDYDFNISYLKLQKAFWYLKNNPDCVWLVATLDKCSAVGSKGPIIGMWHFAESIFELIGKKYIVTGKPSTASVNHIIEKYKITQPDRALFVGDSIHSDMAVGAQGGFQKLLVLSGLTNLENLTNWQDPEEYKPEYYVENLGVLNDIITSIYNYNTLKV